ncbi:MAG: hypothetical protein DI539_28155 [Flavobacterium psychrophilum]|nr:MAG: hypothetical protein DI539_28155 [Flavobacterium psychrophilum]
MGDLFRAKFAGGGARRLSKSGKGGAEKGWAGKKGHTVVSAIFCLKIFILLDRDLPPQPLAAIYTWESGGVALGRKNYQKNYF